MNNITELKSVCTVQNIINKFCWTIGMIPSSYKESLTYEEQLISIGNYLETTVIPALNNNAEAVSELQSLFIDLKNYVDNFFDDLNIQTEINNKLDEMLKDGSLANIVLNFMSVQKIYNSTIDLINDTSILPNQKVKTLGYYQENDGGNAEFFITDSLNENFYQLPLSNNLYATLIINHPFSVKQIGAYGNGSSDDTIILKNMFHKCRAANITSIFFPKGKYLINDTILPFGIDGLSLIGEKYDIYNSTIILRNSDCTVFNFGGTMTLEGISNRASDITLNNLTFRDTAETFTINPFATFHYSQHCSILNCTISCRNKALDLKHLYDSRFINTDFTGGGNINSPMIAIHGGKHASPNEIGWDSANCITFECCRFERYYGTAISTITETQPSSINPIYDPAVAINPNTIWFNMCRFEAPTLLEGSHMILKNCSGIRLNTQFTILDGQPNLSPILFDNASGIFGDLYVSYNQSKVAGPNVTFNDFEQPIINIINNSSKFNLNLIVGNVYSHYLLDYFINLEAGDSTRRTININLIYNAMNKKLYNQTSSNANINIHHQGRIISYGNLENGFGSKLNDNDFNQFFNSMSYNQQNQYYSLTNSYANSQNSIKSLDTIIATDNFTYHRYDNPIVNNNTLMITPNKYPSSLLSYFRSNGTNTRALMYSNEYPTSPIDNVLFKAGDIIFNTLPTSGGNVGWVCTTSGNPGTWKSFGVIS